MSTLTLKNQEWYKNHQNKKGTYVFSQHLSNLQVSNLEKDYYNEVGNTQRCGIPENNIDSEPFDIAYYVCHDELKGETLEAVMKKGMKMILREKILNDLNVYDKMLEDMKEKGVISNINDAKLDLDDILGKCL